MEQVRHPSQNFLLSFVTTFDRRNGHFTSSDQWRFDHIFEMKVKKCILLNPRFKGLTTSSFPDTIPLTSHGWLGTKHRGDETDEQTIAHELYAAMNCGVSLQLNVFLYCTSLSLFIVLCLVTRIIIYPENVRLPILAKSHLIYLAIIGLPESLQHVS